MAGRRGRSTSTVQKYVDTGREFVEYVDEEEDDPMRNFALGALGGLGVSMAVPGVMGGVQGYRGHVPTPVATQPDGTVTPLAAADALRTSRAASTLGGVASGIGSVPWYGYAGAAAAGGLGYMLYRMLRRRRR